MINILVMSHGEFAEGICKSAEMIIGEQENLKTVIFNPGESLDTLVEKLKKAINEFDNDFSHLLLVDIFGGSPSNATALLLAENYKINAVSGVNLPMLVEVINYRLYADADATIMDAMNKAIQAASDGVQKFHKSMVVIEDENEGDDL